jgi:hypothetical protein
LTVALWLVVAKVRDRPAVSKGAIQNSDRYNFDIMKRKDRKVVAYYVLNRHKPRTDEECSELLDQRKEANL